VAALVFLVALCGPGLADARAGASFTLSGDTLTAQGGYLGGGGFGPDLQWAHPSTNYNFIITSTGSDGVTDTNRPGYPGADWNTPVKEDAQTVYGTVPYPLLLSGYSNLLGGEPTVISGRIPANGLAMSDGNDANEFLQIGVATKEAVNGALGFYMSGLVNKTVFLTFSNPAGPNHAASIGRDGAFGPTLTFNGALDLDYELVIDPALSLAKFRIDNGGGWSAYQSLALTAGMVAQFDEAALLVGLFGGNSDDGSAAFATFGDIRFVVPEPAGLSLAALACALGVVRRGRRVRRG
jgi:hypothetical protein